MASAQREEARTERIRLLLVDDSRDNLVSLEATLQGLADELVCAQSGTEVLRHMLENDDFAAILLDVKMPEMDGFEIAELIRTRRSARHTPILFLTAYRSDDHLFRGYDLGAVDFLFKPIVPEILRSKVSVFIELARNVQMLKRQREVSVRAEQKFRSLLEAAPDATFITRADGRIMMVNTPGCDLFGYVTHELLDQNLTSLIPRWRQGSSGYDLMAARRNGTQFPVEISQSPLNTEEGLLITTVVRDITERKKAEESIRELNAELERRVAERTAALTRSTEALRQFAWAASHDLQEPLRMVVAYSQLLQRKSGQWLNESATQLLETIVSSAIRMEQLLAGLREFMQASDQNSVRLERVDSERALDRALQGLADSTAGARATIKRSPLPMVIGNEVLLAQVFQNLISNALKYRSERPVEVQISAEHSDDECTFSIRDNGIGIAPEYHERIFGVFKRLHRDEYPGTGIGLAICKGVVARLGGRIWVESELGAGANFRFVLRAAAN